MEEDGWEVVKCYLSDHLASDSQDEKQLNKARREAASNKKKREANKLKDRKKQFWKCPPPPPPLPLSLFRRNIETFGYSDEGQSSHKNQFKASKICYSCRKEGHFQYYYPFRRTG